MDSDGESLRHDKIRKIIVIVGGGASGSVIARTLRKKRHFSIIVADKNIDRAKMFIKNKKGITFLEIKSAKDLLKQLNGNKISLLINAAPATMNKAYIEVALKLNTAYLDLSSINNYEAEQLKFHKRFLRRQLKAWINFAAAPGTTNVVVRHLTEDLDWAEVTIYVYEQTDSKQAVRPWCPTVALNEGRSRIKPYENWAFRKPIKPFSRHEDHKFRGLEKPVTVYVLNENEGITIPVFLKNIRTLRVRCGGSDVNDLKIFAESNSKYSVQELNRLVPATPTPDELKGLIKSGLLKNGRLKIEIEVSGQRDGDNIHRFAWINFPSLKKIQKLMPGANHVSYPSGVMAAIGAQLLLKSSMIGVWPPECLALHNRLAIFERLAHYGIRAHFKQEKP